MMGYGNVIGLFFFFCKIIGSDGGAGGDKGAIVRSSSGRVSSDDKDSFCKYSDSSHSPPFSWYHLHNQSVEKVNVLKNHCACNGIELIQCCGVCLE